MPLIQDDHVIQQIAPATSNPALRHTVLPRTAKGSSGWLASHVPHSRNHIGSKLGVAVEEQESVRLLVSPCFSQLLYHPRRHLRLCSIQRFFQINCIQSRGWKYEVCCRYNLANSSISTNSTRRSSRVAS